MEGHPHLLPPHPHGCFCLLLFCSQGVTQTCWEDSCMKRGGDSSQVLIRTLFLGPDNSALQKGGERDRGSRKRRVRKGGRKRKREKTPCEGMRMVLRSAEKADRSILSAPRTIKPMILICPPSLLLPQAFQFHPHPSLPCVCKHGVQVCFPRGSLEGWEWVYKWINHSFKKHICQTPTRFQALI